MKSALKIGLLRARIEIAQFNRQRESVVFTIFFPVMLLAIFGSIFKDTIDKSSGVTFSQYFVAGMIASGLVNSGFQQLAIMIPMERDMGTLKRLRGTPMPISSYFIGKSLLVFYTMTIQIALLLIGGVAFYGISLPQTGYKWWLFINIIILGSACTTILGIAFSALPKSGRGASAVVSPVVIILQFFSGVFFIFSQLPSWMQHVAALFPLKWLTQAMRSVFLPDSFQAQEIAGSWESGRTFAILLAWTFAGLIISLRTFKWER